jgi:hypothetical protein
MDLQLLPTDIIKNISNHLIKNHDFILNEIMHFKLDVGLTNFVFPNNLKKIENLIRSTKKHTILYIQIYEILNK